MKTMTITLGTQGAGLDPVEESRLRWRVREITALEIDRAVRLNQAAPNWRGLTEGVRQMKGKETVFVVSCLVPEALGLKIVKALERKIAESSLLTISSEDGASRPFLSIFVAVEAA